MHASDTTSADIARASLIIIALTVADKALAIIKEMVVAHRFGISPDLDVFNIAYALPGILLLIFTGAVMQAFIPLYHEWRSTAEPCQADARACALLWAATVFFMLLALGLYLLSPQAFVLIGYGFDTVQQQQGVRLQQLLTMLLVIDGAGTVLVALLQARKQFLHMQTAPLFLNIVSIFFLVWYAPRLGVDALVWGLVAGTACKTLYMAVILGRQGFSFLSRFLPQRSELAVFIMLMLPLLGSALLANCNLLVDQVMATSLSAGSVSSLRYAFRVYDMPVQVVILAFSKALFPFISQQAALLDFEGLRRYFRQSLILICLLSVPATAGAIVLSHDLITALFQRGMFDAAAASQTAQILILYSLGLCFSAYCFVNGVFFAALKYTAPLFYMGLLSAGLNILLNYIFMRLMGVQGIALSTTITSVCIVCLFMYLLKRRLGITDFSRVLVNVRIIGLAGLIMLGAGFIARFCLAGLGLQSAAVVCIAGACMLVSFGAMLLLLRTPELQGYYTLVRSLLKRAPRT
jgi:putative peptidoglycan lipid II flippase